MNTPAIDHDIEQINDIVDAHDETIDQTRVLIQVSSTYIRTSKLHITKISYVFF